MNFCWFENSPSDKIQDKNYLDRISRFIKGT